MKLEEELKTKFNSPFHKAGLNIIFTGNWLQNRIEAVLKPFGLSHQQYNVLRILRGVHPKPANLQDITDRMIDKMSNATRLVEKLRIKGYLSRETCPENRRKVEIVISDKGLELLSKLEDVIKANNLKIFKDLSRENADKLNQILDNLRE